MTEKFEIYAPFSGDLQPIEKLDDGVFSNKMLGDGFYITPSQELEKIKVFSPIDGEISQVFDTKHALFFKDRKTNITLLMHFGLDTVTLKGAPFKVNAKKGKFFKNGKKVMIANLSIIKEANLITSTPIVVDEGESLFKVSVEILKTGAVNSGDHVATVTATKAD